MKPHPLVALTLGAMLVGFTTTALSQSPAGVDPVIGAIQ